MMQSTNNRFYAMLTTRFWGATTVLLCALLLQNCQSQLNVIEEESPAEAPPQSGCQPPASETLTQPLGYPPPLTTATHQPKVPPTAFAATSPSTGIRPTASTAPSRNILTQGSPRPFTTSTGELVHFQQVGSQWQAVLQGGTGAYAHKQMLPVVSAECIGVFLARLQGQDVWASRPRIHVMAMPNPPYSPCVYLGKVGLLGGMQESTSQRASQVSRTIAQEGWMKGPTMDLSSGETLTYPYALSLPHGARFTGYRLQPGSVVERASWATWYVGADSRDVIGNIDLRQSIGGRSAGMSATVADVIPLGSVEVTTGRTSENNQRRAHVSSHSHAALILYGNTKRNKLFRRKSRLNIALDVSYVIEASPATSPESPLSPPENILSTPPDRSPTDPPATSSPIPTVSSVSSATPVVVAPAFPYSPHSAPVTATPPPSAKEDKNTACVPPALDIDFSSARSLHKKRMSGLAPTLTESERIELITMYVSDGAKRAEEIVGKNAVIVIGNTGAGKSTWLNYLMGCRMILTPLRRSSMANAAPSEVCPVVPFPIGHTKQSETFMPAIALEPMASDPIAYCDCPGFLDNRGAEINIANAVNIRRILQAARSVRIIILISDVALIADRSRGLTDMLRICTHLFGSLDTIKRHKESLLLGVTQSSVDTKIEELQEELREGTPEIMQILSDRLFLYDPLDRGGADFWNRAKCVANIKALVPMRSTGDLFQTVLDARDEQTLRNIVEQEGKRASDFLSRGQYSQAATCWQTLQRLRVIDKLSVERLLHESEERILGKLSGLEVDFKDACYFHDMGKAKKLLDVFEQITHHFSREANTFDLPSLDALQDHYAKVQHRKQQEEDRDREHNAARIQAAKDKQELLNIIASQKAEMERTQQELARQHVAMREELQLERSGREEAYEQSLAATQEELELALKRHEEALAMVQMLSTEESNRLSEEKEALREEYAEHIKHMQEEWLAEKAVYDLQLAAQQAAQAKKQEEVQSKIDLLSRQHKNEAQHLASLRIPAQAFGAEEWEKYFGEVGEAPPLPSDMVTILDGPCPFWTNKKVRDTHLLVLIPATVGGVPLTLNLLGELIQRPKNGGHRTEYRRYDDLVKAQIGEESPPRPYWLLMTRDVLPKSRSKTYDAQKALVAAHASKLGLPYEMPPALAAATAILLHHAREGERLFGDDPCTFTRCQEKVANNQYPVVVGGFSSGGLVVDYHFSHSLVHYSHDGVSCLRKF